MKKLVFQHRMSGPSKSSIASRILGWRIISSIQAKSTAAMAHLGLDRAAAAGLIVLELAAEIGDFASAERIDREVIAAVAIISDVAFAQQFRHEFPPILLVLAKGVPFYFSAVLPQPVLPRRRLGPEPAFRPRAQPIAELRRPVAERTFDAEFQRGVHRPVRVVEDLAADRDQNWPMDAALKLGVEG